MSREAIADAVTWTARVLPNRPAAPVLSGLLVTASGESDLSLSAFDYDVSARARIEAVVDEPGQVLIPGRVLAEITRNLPDDAVEIATSGNEALLTCASAEFALLTMPAEDFPTLPAMPSRVGTADGSAFAAAVGAVAPAASRDDTLPMLTGIRVDVDGEQMTMAATDRYRIAAKDLQWRPAEAGFQVGTMVPARVLVEVARSLRGGEVALSLGDGVAGFESGGRATTVRLLDEQFIDYRSRLSGSWSIRADVRVTPFIEAVKRVALVAERNTAVRLSFTAGQVLIQAGGGDIGRGAEVIPAELTGDEIQVAFQPHYLLDGLSGVDSEFVRLNMESPTRPVLISEVPGDGAPAYRYLVMTLRLG
ncbi:DNA polymerase III subunit beta [Sinosporangium siamense]|uniref:Beta sliding clamp n=1 Tax=Sinosporangium siamense TaxID=1367973 RepID=A0A919RP18_9ACTN|nr:DNA polymerase III subunit beta [Sinosporangium siamense]